MQERTNKNTRKPHARRPTICVYCGSNTGKDPAYAATARALGRQMAEAGVGLVYGGGGLGLMGEIARAVLAHNGHVTGIIPEFLSKKERMLRAADELIVVKDMHVRKQLMFDKSDAFVALPGGIGTLEELVEQLTWAPLLSLLQHMSREQFIRPDMDVRFITVDNAEAVLPAIAAANQRVPDREPDDAEITQKF
jgi:uncharacterized protein (TIGR00730 family)